MTDPRNVQGCYIAEPPEWQEIFSSYQRGITSVPDAPTRAVTFILEFPFEVTKDDIVLFEAYGAGRGVEHRIYDGPPPEGGQISAQLAVPAKDAAEVYWLSVELIREAERITCGWNAEERFELPAPPAAGTWRVELLRDEIATADGGTRTTRIAAVE